jgi:hypothetical protein
MRESPWTDPDPQPGDFDAELGQLDPSCVEHHEGDPSATLRVVVGVEADDASRLARHRAGERAEPERRGG